MNSHVRKTLRSIQSYPAPRDIEWNRFITMWENIADEVTQESGDRLAVVMNGHRQVFHRQHDGLVGIEDVENARHLLKDRPELKGTGYAYAVAIDAQTARLLRFDLAETDVEDSSEKVRDKDPRAHHLRTVERKTGRDDVADLKGFLDDVAKEVQERFGDEPFVVLGHGTGKADVAALFVERAQDKHQQVAQNIVTTVDIDLSAATDADIEKAVLDAEGR